MGKESSLTNKLNKSESITLANANVLINAFADAINILGHVGVLNDNLVVSPVICKTDRRRDQFSFRPSGQVTDRRRSLSATPASSYLSTFFIQ
jgi:hypothetical protein